MLIREVCVIKLRPWFSNILLIAVCRKESPFTAKKHTLLSYRIYVSPARWASSALTQIESCKSFWFLAITNFFVGKLYVSGGGSKTGISSASCEMFDLTSEQWTCVKNMKYRRRCHGMAAIDGAANKFC